MQPSYKKYILQNIAQKTPAQIAVDLGIKERKVLNFLDRQRRRTQENVSLGSVPSPVGRGFLIGAFLALLLLGLAVYSNSLGGKFLWDDEVLVVRNEFLRHAWGIPKFFTEDIGIGGGARFAFYRPLQMLVYMFVYRLFGLNVAGYHLASVLLHGCSAFLVFLVLYRLFKDRGLALLAAVFFVVHPVHVEAISYIAGLSDPLSLVFVLASFIFYVKFVEDKRPGLLWGAILFYAAAILSRESIVIFPLLLLVYHAVFKQRVKIGPFLIFCGMSIAYLAARMTVLKFLLSAPLFKATLSERLSGFFAALTAYLRLLVWPADLHMEYGFKVFSWLSPIVLAGLLFFAASVASAVYFKQRLSSVARFGLLWFFVGLVPFANIYPINAYMAEHWLYLPSIGLFALLAFGLRRLMDQGAFWRSIALGVAATLAIAWGSVTWRQNVYWSDPLIFYETTLKYAPDSTKMYTNLGGIYQDMGRHEDAVKALQKAIALEPGNFLAYGNLGGVYKSMGRMEEALACYKTAIQIYPNYASSHFNIGNLYKELGRREEAAAAYRRAVQIDPNYMLAYIQLAGVYIDEKKTQEALSILQRGISMRPDMPALYLYLGFAYHAAGRFDEAAAAYKRCITLEPRSVDAYYNLGLVNKALGRTDEAAAALRQAQSLGFPV